MELVERKVLGSVAVLVSSFFFLSSKCSIRYFGGGGTRVIVSVICSIVLSKDIEPFI